MLMSLCMHSSNTNKTLSIKIYKSGIYITLRRLIKDTLSVPVIPCSSTHSYQAPPPTLPFSQSAAQLGLLLQEQELVNNEAVRRVLHILPQTLHNFTLSLVVLVACFAQVVICLLERSLPKGVNALSAKYEFVFD